LGSNEAGQALEFPQLPGSSTPNRVTAHDLADAAQGPLILAVTHHKSSPPLQVAVVVVRGFCHEHDVRHRGLIVAPRKSRSMPLLKLVNVIDIPKNEELSHTLTSLSYVRRIKVHGGMKEKKSLDTRKPFVTPSWERL
jgi:hypothetical protein